VDTIRNLPKNTRNRAPSFHHGVAESHDHLFQLTFADPEHARPLLRSALPAAVAGTIDWRTLSRHDPGHRGRRGKRTVCDVLFEVRLRAGGDLLLYVVLEHKSASKRFDALQMLEQVTAVLRSHCREHPHERFLPPVLPIIVHADHRPWRSTLDVRGLFDLERIPQALQRFLPSLVFVLDDLHEQPPERLRQRALTVFGLCTLSTLQYLPPAARDEYAFAAWLDAWGDVQEQAARRADTVTGRELYDEVVDYILRTSDLPRPVVQRVLTHRLTDSAMKKKFVSTLMQTRNEGRVEGKAEGKVEGRVEGKVEGKAEGVAEALLRLITRRFGPPADDVAARIRSAPLANLERWTDRILDARTLADLLAG
jgi:predicted transposase YdaD